MYADPDDELHLSGTALIGSAPEDHNAGKEPLKESSDAAKSILRGPFNVEMIPTAPSNVGLRCVALRPGSSDVAVGDRQGTIR